MTRRIAVIRRRQAGGQPVLPFLYRSSNDRQQQNAAYRLPGRWSVVLLLWSCLLSHCPNGKAANLGEEVSRLESVSSPSATHGSGARDEQLGRLAGVAKRCWSENFVVISGSEEVSHTVSQQAEVLRQAIALQWLGGTLPQVEHMNVVRLAIDSNRSSARTRLGSSEFGHHVWISSSHREAIEHLLPHEIAHTVLADHFGTDLDYWITEGVASQYDDLERKQIRARLLGEWCREQTWPRLASVMSGTIRTQREYTAAASLTEYLIALRGRCHFIRFAEASVHQGEGKPSETELAKLEARQQLIARYYGMSNERALQRGWQNWVRNGGGQRNFERVAKRADNGHLVIR